MLMFLPAILPLLEGLFARAAAGAASSVVEGGAAEAVGSKLFSGFVESKVAKTASETAKGEIEPPAAGMVRLFHGGQPLNGAAEPRWVTQDLKYAQGYAEKSEGSIVHYVDVHHSHPELARTGKAFDDSGTGQKAPYNPFEASAEIMRYAKPYQTESDSVNPASSVRNWIDSQIATSQSGLSASQPIGGSVVGPTQSTVQGQRSGQSATATTPATAPALNASRNQTQGSSIVRYAANLFNAVNQPSQGSQQSPQNSPSGQSPKFTYYPDQDYRRIDPHNLLGFHDRQQAEQQGVNANPTSPLHAKQVENQRQLVRITDQLSGSFNGLLTKTRQAGVMIGSLSLPFLIAKGVTGITSRTLEGDIDKHATYNASFAWMEAQRRFQDISLSRQTAEATTASEKWLNRENMQGKELANNAWTEIKDSLNLIQAAGQHVINWGLAFPEIVQTLRGIHVIKEAAKKWLGLEDNKKPIDPAAKAIEFAIKGQDQSRQEKRLAPIKKVK